MEAKMGMFEGLVALTVLYGCEAWAENAVSRKRMEVLKMKSIYPYARLMSPLEGG